MREDRSNPEQIEPGERPDDRFEYERAREATLLAAYDSGDATALTELLQMNEDRVFAVCRRMAPSVEDARDLCQETFVKAIQGLSGFNREARLSTWITRIAINVCLTDRRRRGIRQMASLDAPGAGGGAGGGEPGQGLGAGTPDAREPRPEERVESDEARERLARAMRVLDPAQRAILILRDGQDLDYAAIAEVLGVPAGTVKSRIFRARVALRKQLDEIERSQRDAGRGEEGAEPPDSQAAGLVRGSR